MPTRVNTYFNNPNFAAAAGNLAAMFAPPSAQDELAYAKASGERWRNDTLQGLYGSVGNDFDRQAILLDLYDPTSSFYAVDTASADRRYGVDVGAATTLATNAADNDRALRTGVLTAATNPAGSQPLTDEQLLSITGIPMPGALPGAQPVMPTQAQLQGEVFSGMDPDLQAAITFGSTPVENVQTPDGPRIATRLDSIGQAPVLNQGSQASIQEQTYMLNGQPVRGYFNPTSGVTTLADGSPMPPEAIRIDAVESNPNDLGVTGSNVTEYNRVQAAAHEIDLITRDMESLINSQGGAAGIVGAVQSTLQNFSQVMREVSAAMGGADAPVTPEMLSALNAQMSQGPFNPVFQQIRSYMLRLAYANARLANPSGEVGQIALARELEMLGQGLLGNDESVKAALTVSRQNAAIRLSGAEALVGRQPTPVPSLAGQNAVAAGTAQPAGPPPEAIDMLRSNPTPQAQAQFDEVFGAGAAARVLGGAR